MYSNTFNFTTTDELINEAKPQAKVRLITKGGVVLAVQTCMSPSDFLTIFNDRSKTMAFATGNGGVCKIVKKDVSVVDVTPLSPFSEYQ